MKFGITADWRNEADLRAAKAAGADYVETAFSSFSDASKEEIAALHALLKALDLPLLCCNVMLPGGVRVTGKHKDPAATGAYVKGILEKIAPLGVKMVVFGSGAARKMEEGADYDTAFSEVVAFLQDVVSPLFSAYGITCVFEPLSECNFLRSMQDGLKLVKAVDRENVKLLADFYHVAAVGEALSGYEAYAPYLRHTHIASYPARRFPKAEEDYSAVFAALKAAGYDGSMSIEAGRDDRELALQMKESFAVLKAAAGI